MNKFLMIFSVFLIFFIPQIFAESISSNVGNITIDESIIEISNNEDYSLKIYGMINPSEFNNRGHIQITLPDGTTDGGLFVPTNDGYFELFFDINHESQLGDYKILGTYGNKIIGNLIFSVSEKAFTVEEIKEIRDETSKQDAIAEAAALKDAQEAAALKDAQEAAALKDAQEAAALKDAQEAAALKDAQEAAALKDAQEAAALKDAQEAESIINTPTNPSTSNMQYNSYNDIEDNPLHFKLFAGLIIVLMIIFAPILFLQKLGLLKLLGGMGGIKWFSAYSFDGKRRSFNKATKDAVLARQGYRCNICGISPENWDYDHIGSRSDNSIGNCQALCLDCHRNKTRYENRR